VRRRQQNGELATALDPAYVLLALFAAASAPTVIPQIVQRITGKFADSEEFVSTHTDQLRRIVEHLGSGPIDSVARRSATSQPPVVLDVCR
jgi:TetR/AcrR family transcriptional regulator